METTFKFLQEIKWLIQPIYDIIVYFITSNSGFYWLILIFAFYVIFSLMNAIRQRIFFANSSRNHRKNISLIEILYIITSELSGIFFKIIIKTPLVIGILLLFLFVGGFSKEIKKIDAFIEKSNQKEEIKSVFKHIDKKIKIAEVSVLSKKDSETNLLDFKFRFCDINGEILPNDTQVISLKGNIFYISSIIFNFSYSSIADFKSKNLFIIDKIYTNEIAENQGVKLNFNKEKQLPYFYKLSEKELWGIDKTVYETQLKSLLSLSNKLEEAKKLGVKIEKITLSDKLFKGQKFWLWIDMNGKLSIEKKYYRRNNSFRNE